MGGKETMISLLASFIHECGHFVTSKIIKIHLKEFNFDFLGAKLKTEEKIYSYKKEVFLCLGGPLFNFISVLILHVLCLPKSPATELFSYTAVALGTLNLLPIKSFDGGRIFEIILSTLFSPTTSEIIVSILSFLSLLLLWICSVYILLIYDTSVGLFVFSISVFCHLFIKDS